VIGAFLTGVYNLVLMVFLLVVMIENLGILWLNAAAVVVTFGSALVLAVAIKVPDDYLRKAADEAARRASIAISLKSNQF